MQSQIPPKYKAKKLISSKLTTSSTIDSAILMISIAFFISGSARGSNGTSRGDSSATIEKINQFEVTKTNAEAKRPQNNTYVFLAFCSFLSLFRCHSSVMNIFFTFLHNFVSHFSATICPDVSVKFSAH
jgi:hypothetical protein